MSAPHTSPSGRYTTIEEGVRAYIPNPLPPDQPWDTKVVGGLSRASYALGALATTIKTSPVDPPVIPFLMREAVWSRRLETRSPSLLELLMGRVSPEHGPPDGVVRQINQYANLMMQAGGTGDMNSTDLASYQQWHRDLCHPQPDAGSFRTTPHWIGPPGQDLSRAWYIGPPPEHVKEGMKAYAAFMHQSVLPPLIQLGLGHYQLEAIHPFAAGHGIWVRAVCSIWAARMGPLAFPILGISEYVHAHRKEYFKRLEQVRRSGAWDAWLVFFLEGITHSARQLQKKWEQYVQVLQQAHEAASRESSRVPTMVLALLSQNPYVTARYVSEQLAVAFTTAQRAIVKLQQMDLLEQSEGAHRYRIYGAPALVQILGE